MKEYLTKNSNGDYQLVNHRFSDDDIKVPDGAEIAYLHKDNGIEFSKMQEGEFYRYYWGEWYESLFDNIQELSQETFFDSVLWKRSTIVEYLNPADWSLHVFDVDNDAAGEDWIKVPDGAEALTECMECGELFRLWWKGECKICIGYDDDWFNIQRDIDDYLSDTKEAKILWSRFSQPEELPFVDNEPKGQKHDSAKPRMSLLPKGVLSSVISVLEFGAKKYQEDNWKQVGNAKTRYYDAMQRHIGAWWDGEKNDPETGEHHLAHAICCAMFLIWFDKEQSQ